MSNETKRHSQVSQLKFFYPNCIDFPQSRVISCLLWCKMFKQKGFIHQLEENVISKNISLNFLSEVSFCFQGSEM